MVVVADTPLDEIGLYATAVLCGFECPQVAVDSGRDDGRIGVVLGFTLGGKARKMAVLVPAQSEDEAVAKAASHLLAWARDAHG